VRHFIGELERNTHAVDLKIEDVGGKVGAKVLASTQNRRIVDSNTITASRRVGVMRSDVAFNDLRVQCHAETVRRGTVQRGERRLNAADKPRACGFWWS
jgi:hypothetical protein